MIEAKLKINNIHLVEEEKHANPTTLIETKFKQNVKTDERHADKLISISNDSLKIDAEAYEDDKILIHKNNYYQMPMSQIPLKKPPALPAPVNGFDQAPIVIKQRHRDVSKLMPNTPIKTTPSGY